jgi:hypothetical protein
MGDVIGVTDDEDSIMKRSLCVTPLAVAALLGAVAVGLAAQDDSFEWKGRMNAGTVLEIKGISADIWAELADGDHAEVVATKRGRSRDFDEVDFEVFQDGEDVTVCVIYRDRRGRWTSCEPRGWDNMDLDDIDVSVDFSVRVPAGVEFVGSTISGDVEAEGLESDVVARTISGRITVSTTGIAEATTVSGSIRASMGRSDWNGDLQFKTVSGSITVELPSGLDTEVEFESLSGNFDSDFPITVRSTGHRWIGGRIRGTIGEGGRYLNLATVSGDVRLMRR